MTGRILWFLLGWIVLDSGAARATPGTAAEGARIVSTSYGDFRLGGSEMVFADGSTSYLRLLGPFGERIRAQEPNETIHHVEEVGSTVWVISSIALYRWERGRVSLEPTLRLAQRESLLERYATPCGNVYVLSVDARFSGLMYADAASAQWVIARSPDIARMGRSAELQSIVCEGDRFLLTHAVGMFPVITPFYLKHQTFLYEGRPAATHIQRIPEPLSAPVR